MIVGKSGRCSCGRQLYGFDKEKDYEAYYTGISCHGCGKKFCTDCLRKEREEWARLCSACLVVYGPIESETA